MLLMSVKSRSRLLWGRLVEAGAWLWWLLVKPGGTLIG